MRLEDLSPAMQAQAVAKLGAQVKQPRKSRAGVGLSEPCPGSCSCGETFPTALAWEKHRDQVAGPGHIWSIDLTALRCD